LGLVLKAVGEHEAARAAFQEALRCQPDHAEASHELGNLLTEQGKLGEAESHYRFALRLNPQRAETYHNLAIALQHQGRWQEAAASCEEALRRNPNLAAAHFTLGAALQSQGRLDDAIACYQRSLALNPQFTEAHYNLGKAFQSQDRLTEAIVSYRQALSINPDLAEAHANMGNALQKEGRLDEAVAAYREAVRVAPDFALAHNYLGHGLRMQGKLDEAVAACRRALELEPDSPGGVLGQLVGLLQQQCKWDEVEELAKRLVAFIEKPEVRSQGSGVRGQLGDQRRTIDAPVDPLLFMALPVPTTAEQHQLCSAQWLDNVLRSSMCDVRSQPGAPGTSRSAHRTLLTIGYLSADFHEHATAYLIAEMIEKHDREHFTICGYSIGPDDGSPMRRRMIKAFDRFVDLRQSSLQNAAQCIQQDQVDILVDLKGYTNQARTPIMALRPAPIQAQYLAYPGTMAASFIDYILVDDFVVPPDQQPFFTEKLVHLPGCYQVNDRHRRIADQTPTRAECGLPVDAFVYCCFNSPHKITPQMFGIWMQVLKAVPRSVLWLLETNRYVAVNLRREAEARGVSSERLAFASRLGLPAHLARHGLADLFLDTLPYNAHTTGSDSLWAGCPVLTMAGQTFPSRVGGSLLRAIGLPELITTNLEEYQKLAVRLAKDGKLLGELRTRLAANRDTSSLFDGERFARNVEKAYSKMWEIYATGEAPRAFAIPT
jgi:predicted O-linked N-acetylglucosamine transferase (SPINDLY family)